MKWENDAEKALSKVPFFVRGRVKRRVEEEAARCGAAQVSLAHVQTCQKRFLHRMEDEVKGHRVETCFGHSGCPNRAVSSEELSRSLEDRLSKRDLKAFLKTRVKGPLKLHHEFRVTLSDCPNACSRPQIADAGIMGACLPGLSGEPCTECSACVDSCQERAISLQNGSPVIDFSMCLACGQCIGVCPAGTLKRKKEGYRMLVGGKLGRHPRLAEELPGIHDAGKVIHILERCLDIYKEHCVKGERFGEILERMGPRAKEGLLGCPEGL